MFCTIRTIIAKFVFTEFTKQTLVSNQDFNYHSIHCTMTENNSSIFQLTILYLILHICRPKLMLGQLLFPNWTVMPRVVEHYLLLLQQKVLLFSLEQVIIDSFRPGGGAFSFFLIYFDLIYISLLLLNFDNIF